MNNIVLTGFMGTGKSVVGLKLAKMIGYKFIDVDKLIEEREKLSISDIFAKHGERYFRQKEKEIIREIGESDKSVIATGGGTVIDNENREVLKKKGTLICLKASPEVIISRTANSKSRPLLNSPDRFQKIITLLNEREEAYSQADFSVDTTDMSVKDIVETIIEKIKEQK